MKFGIGFFIGVLIGIALLFALPRLSIPPNHLINRWFGIQRPWLIGFQPYWTLSKTLSQTPRSLNNLTYFGLEIARDGHLVQRTSPQETEPGWLKLSDTQWQSLAKPPWWQEQQRSLTVHNSREGSISAILSDPEKHAKTLAADLQPLVLSQRFHDINLDIESFQDTEPATQAAFLTFAKTLKQELNRNLVAQKSPPVTLTIDVAPVAFFRPFLIDPHHLNEAADRVVLMAYDFHYTGSFVSGPVAPLGGAPDHYEFDIPTAVAVAKQFVPPQKIILGIPLYGYEWETFGQTPEAAVIPGTGKTVTLQKVVDLLQNCVGCQQSYDNRSQQAVLMIPSTEAKEVTRQIFYENTESLRAKLQFAREQQLGGVALWALGYETPETIAPMREYFNVWKWR